MVFTKKCFILKKERKMKRLVIIFVCLFLMSSSITLATPLIYTPVNPSFGGSPFNAAWLMSSAQSQNKLTEKKEPWKMPERDPIEDFKNSLNRQILYNLSRKIIDGAFGEEGITEGIYNLDDYIINVSSNNGGIKVILTDSITGNETIIEVPYY